ncbi:hypothetical protein KC325_g82 [Hortaea werneckii]|nr:hypothetical protein KC325_g82 [Hortaea werneckii]
MCDSEWLQSSSADAVRTTAEAPLLGLLGQCGEASSSNLTSHIGNQGRRQMILRRCRIFMSITWLDGVQKSGKGPRSWRATSPTNNRSTAGGLDCMSTAVLRGLTSAMAKAADGGFYMPFCTYICIRAGVEQ